MNKFLFVLLLCFSSLLAANFDGVFVFDPANSADISKAIESSIADMNFVTRPVARSRLTKTNLVPQQVSIHTDANGIDLIVGKAHPPKLPSNGSAVQWLTPDGENVQVSEKQNTASLVETIQGEDGAKKNTFTLSPDGAQLFLDVLVSSAKLPKPLTYRLAFKRQ